MDPPTATGRPAGAWSRGGLGLGSRVLIICGVLGVLIVAPVIATWWTLRDVHVAEAASSDNAMCLALTNQLERAAVDVQSAVDTYAVLGGAQFFRVATTALDDVEDAIAAVEGTSGRDPDPVVADAIVRLSREFAARRASIVDTARRDRAAARRLVAGAGSLTIVELRAAIAVRVVALEARGAELSARIDRNAHRSQLLLIVSTLTVPAAILLILLYVRARIAQPVRKVAHAARKVAAGDHSVRVGDLGRGEIADLARAFDAMVDEVYRAAREIRAQNLQIQHEKEQSDRERAITEAVLEATPTAICLIDPDGQVLVANRSGRDLPPEVLRPSTAVDDEKGRFDEYVDPASGRSFHRYVAELALDHGRAGSLLVIREVTAELSAERAKADLVMTVSHELRTPLAAVVGYSELLVRRELDPDTRMAYAEMIHDQAMQLESLVTALLDLRRIEEGGLNLAATEFDIVELLREKRALYMGQSDAHSLSLMGAQGPVTVLADRDRIGQVVANLISNAIKYSPRGGVIRLGAELRNGRARVWVQDSGVGIPARDRRRVFERFVRLEGAFGVGGTGLGLAIVDEIIRLHGGEVGVVGEPDRGSTFWFELPAERVVGAEAKPATTAPGDGRVIDA